MVNRIKPVDPVICISRQGFETTITKMLMGLQKKKRCNGEDVVYLKKQTIKK